MPFGIIPPNSRDITFLRRMAVFGLWLFLAPVVLTDLCAQEAFRASLAGQAAAEARQLALANQRFNLRLGPASIRFRSALSTEFTDNVRYSENDRQADLIIRPQVSAEGVWLVTDKNVLTLSLGVGYGKYLNATEYDGLFVAPGSDLAFDIYIKDVKLTLYNRFSFSQDVTGDPMVSGIGGLDRFENAAGLNMAWDLNKLIIGAGYEYDVFLPTEDFYANQRRSSHLFNTSAALLLGTTARAGLQAGGGLTEYDLDQYSNNQHISVGPFFGIQPSEYLNVRLAGGYVMYFFDPSLSVTNTENLDAFYADLSLNHRASQFLTHSLSVGHQLRAGYFSDSQNLLYARHTASWRLFLKTTLQTSLSYERVEETREFGEIANRFGVGIGLARSLTQRLTGSLRYQYYLKDSDLENRSYTQNGLVLDLRYTF